MQLIKIISGYTPGKRINIEQPTPGATGLERGSVQSNQPQPVEKLYGIRCISAGWFCEAAAAGPAQRDTAALRCSPLFKFASSRPHCRDKLNSCCRKNRGNPNSCSDRKSTRLNSSHLGISY